MSCRSLLLEEAQSYSSLEHPYIVGFFALVFEPGNYGFILEFSENGNMEDFLRTRQVGWEEKLRMICNICEGMKYLHSQTPPIIHGDLKLRNILISGNNTAKVFECWFYFLPIFVVQLGKNEFDTHRLSSHWHQVKRDAWNNIGLELLF